MWCKNCQQDVPAIASPEEQVPRCAKCHSSFDGGEAAESPATDAGKPAWRASSSRGFESGWLDKPTLDDWELDEDLHETERLVASLAGRSAPADTSLRIDAAHRAAPGNIPAARPVRHQSSRPAASGSSSLFSWFLLSVGLMAFVFGGVLLGWSFATDRADLWRIGMPFAMAGQAALIIGLVFQLDGLSKSNRTASNALEELDVQLDELRHTTSLLSTTRSSPSQSFYLHMAEGASPKLLLADLKGQLDLLAERMADTR